MIAGHFGFAAIVKSRRPRVPLWSLMLATVWLDVLCIPLLLLKVETIHTVPGLPGGYGENIIHADYTHSLLGSLLLSAAYGFIFLPRWGRRCAAVLAFVSFSHWLLDLVVHRHDMPLLPDNAWGLPRLGFGLWQIREVSIAVELFLVVAGAWCYWRAAAGVAGPAQQGRVRAIATALMILLFGVMVLTLDVRG